MTLTVNTVSRMWDGSEFQTAGAVTEKAHPGRKQELQTKKVQSSGPKGSEQCSSSKVKKNTKQATVLH